MPRNVEITNESAWHGKLIYRQEVVAQGRERVLANDEEAKARGVVARLRTGLSKIFPYIAVVDAFDATRSSGDPDRPLSLDEAVERARGSDDDSPQRYLLTRMLSGLVVATTSLSIGNKDKGEESVEAGDDIDMRDLSPLINNGDLLIAHGRRVQEIKREHGGPLMLAELEQGYADDAMDLIFARSVVPQEVAS